MRGILSTLALLLCALLASAAATAGCADEHENAPAELLRADAQLSLLADGTELWSGEAADARPYKIVSTGQPPLAVSMDGLSAVCWAAGETPIAYRDMLPQQVNAPLVALSELSTEAIYRLGGLVLLRPDGSALWESDSAALLTPYTCDGDCSRVAYIAQTADGDAMYPYGSEPVVSAVDCASGDVLWESALPAVAPAADALLLAADGTGLLFFLQYDFEVAQFLLLDRATGELRATVDLAGQLATNLVYPGPAEEPAQIALTQGSFSVLLILSSGGFERWSISLSTGELHTEKVEAPASRVREVNANAVGGSLAPGPGRAPFPQRLLPEASGGQWRIPALRRADGAVFVVRPAGAEWLLP